MLKRRLLGVVLGVLLVLVGLPAFTSAVSAESECQDYFLCFYPGYPGFETCFPTTCFSQQRRCENMCETLGGVDSFTCPGENCCSGCSGPCYAECVCTQACSD